MKTTCCRLAILIALALPALAPAAEPTTLNIDVDGVQREALIFVPIEKPKSRRSPLLLVFHGHGGNIKSASRNMRFQQVWPEAIVVYPQGLNTPTRVDPEGKRPGWQRSPGDQKDRDLKLVDSLLATIRKKYEVDDKRIYAAGFSNGSVFTYLLWAERPQVFAALAPCAGLPMPDVHPKTPKPVFVVAGEKDPLVKFESQQAAIEAARKLDDAMSDGKLTNGVTVYKSDRGTPVETLIHRGGHVLPPDAPKRIVGFLRAHELK